MAQAGYTPEALAAAVRAGNMSDSELVALARRSQQPTGQAQRAIPAVQPAAVARPGVPGWLLDPAAVANRRAELTRALNQRGAGRAYRADIVRQLDDLRDPQALAARYEKLYARQQAQQARQQAQQARRAAGARTAEEIRAAGPQVGAQLRKVSAAEQRELFGANVVGRADVQWNAARDRYRLRWSAGFGGDFYDIEVTPDVLARIAAAGEQLTRENASRLARRYRQ